MAVIPQPETLLTVTLNWTAVRDRPGQEPYHAHVDMEWRHVPMSVADAFRDVISPVAAQFPDRYDGDDQIRVEMTVASLGNGRRHFADRVICRMSQEERDTAWNNLRNALATFGQPNANDRTDRQPAASPASPAPPATPAQPPA